ncbi:uncharacterized protein I303_105545 [Kwoniella dejecticola CBS 10117]|uniref:Mediator of RNA polymerase II transcription subunit 31 n=1 Tax=Kwoniella dejecticola CBS 10117 TaxID=1296121 RepID=A0A1A6A265_9TREE|nr:uncharacterized protein I303_05012 [Kwoniella dejecticola CBS 10117]OBR84155.1 hypothetical protein I303_05012 [Kwoniella dejecticola CBS 10117]
MQQYPTILPPPARPDGTQPIRSEEKENNLIRFQAELEFVQCLSNPQYIHSLATQGYFQKQSFINYLKYLEYWRDPEYIKYIIFPTSLIYLTLLQSDLFRARSSDIGFINELIRVGTKHHETWRVEKPSGSDTSATGPTKIDVKDQIDKTQTQGHDEDEG